MRISKYKNTFSKDFQPNWTANIFVIKKKFKEEGDKLYVKRKGHDNCFDSGINKSDLI